VTCGERVTKTWRVRNSSATEPWPASTRLVHVGGDLLSGPVLGVAVPPVRPGDMVDISVPFVMPAEPGRYTSYWRLTTGPPTSSRFGHRFWVQVAVVAPTARVPTAPPAPVPGPGPAPAVANGAADAARLEQAVTQIVEFGFTDIDRIVQVLREVEGDTARAIDRLLEN